MGNVIRSNGLKLIWFYNVTDNLLFSQSKTGKKEKETKNQLQTFLSLLKYITLQFIFRNKWPRELIVLDARLEYQVRETNHLGSPMGLRELSALSNPASFSQYLSSL